MVKRPDRPFPTPQVDMSDMGLNVALDEAIKVVEAPAEMPKQLWEWIIGDWKQKFVVTGVAYKQTGGDILAYDPKEGADVAGVNPAVNLFNLVVNPKKELGKMWGTMFNPLNPFAGLTTIQGEFWTDLDTSVERDMWRRLVKKEGPPGSEPFLHGLAEKAFADSSGNPLNLTGQGVFKDKKLWTAGLTKEGTLRTVEELVAGKTDVYDELAGNILGFVAGKKSIIQRNPRFTSMQNSFIGAAATELKLKKAVIDTAITASSGVAAAKDVRTNIGDFLLEADVVESLGGFSTGIGNFGRVISRNGLKGPAGTAIIGGTVGLDVSVTELRNSINSVRAGIADATKKTAFDRDVRGIEDILTKAEGFSTKIKEKVLCGPRRTLKLKLC